MPEARPLVRPRSEWGAGLPARGPLQVEGDVRFLLVHHTATPDAPPERSVEQLRAFYRHHTVEKGWPDIAYNFLIDSGGEIWEGRTGSLSGPVRGDATGGSQGHAILCCFIGDFSSHEPTPRAVDAMTRLLGWLADTHRIDLTPGRQVSFISRGSNRWPVGARVTTPPIAGHRDMSMTTCPGDKAYALIETRLLPGARRAAGQGAPAESSPTPTEPRSSTSQSSTPSFASSSRTAASGVSSGARDDPADIPWPVSLGGVVGAAGLAAGAWVINRRMSRPGR